ncbi:tape measure protein [Mycobacterium phage Blinn1]|uniref:Tape measure protein n=1 Tax=Mycobacterium phage Blinn1 TaxID=2656562 RepID=A0A649VRC3_9CAUD|nr:tail length tape measure protein [Mycobacterium phage Blinn1]QGJ94791.1 tape measure protein [Mycobacterium phage Blinn1]
MPNSAGVEVARISVKVSPDTRQFRRDLKSDLEEIERTMKVTVDVAADTDQFRKELKRDIAEIERTTKATIGVKADLDNFRKEVETRTKGMRTKVKVEPDVDRGFFSRLTEKLSNIDGPSFGSGINPAGYGLIFAGILSLAAPLIGLLTSALLTIPGLIAAVATPIAALTLGLDGLKKAAEVLKGPFEDLKAVMSANVEDQFTPVFQKLRDIFPTLKSSLPTVTQGLADIANAIVNTVTAPENLTKIDETIRNIGQALTDASPGIASFTDGLINLANKFSEKFPGIVDWFNGAGKSFSDFIDKASKDGTLDKAFSGLGDTLKILVDGLGKLSEAGLEFMKDPKKLEDFKNGLQDIVNLLTQIVDLSAKVGSGLNNFLPSFSFDGFNQDVGNPFTSPDAGWRDIWADMKAGAEDAYNRITSTFSQMGTDIANVFSSIGSTASNAWNSVVSAVQNAWESIVSAVANGVAQAVQFVSTLPDKIRSFFADAGTWLLDAGRNIVQGLINGIGDMIGSAVAKAKELASSVAGAVKGFLGIHSPSKLFEEFGINTGQGYALGLDKGFAPVLEQAKDLAAQVAAAVATGTEDPTALLHGYSKQDVNRFEKVLGTEIKRYERQAKALDLQAKTTGNEGLKAEAAKLREMKEQLQTQKEMLDLVGDYNDETSSGAKGSSLEEQAGHLLAAPADFAKSVGKTFLSDIGIGGDGFLSRALTEGTKYIFQIGSVDEALSIKDREESKQALSVVGRQ